MAKKQQNQKKKTQKGQSSFVSQKPKVSVKPKKKTTDLEVNKTKAEVLAIKISKMQSDARTFLEMFKADIAKKRKEWQEYNHEFQKKRLL